MPFVFVAGQCRVKLAHVFIWSVKILHSWFPDEPDAAANNSAAERSANSPPLAAAAVVEEEAHSQNDAHFSALENQNSAVVGETGVFRPVLRRAEPSEPGSCRKAAIGDMTQKGVDHQSTSADALELPSSNTEAVESDTASAATQKKDFQKATSSDALDKDQDRALEQKPVACPAPTPAGSDLPSALCSLPAEDLPVGGGSKMSAAELDATSTAGLDSSFPSSVSLIEKYSHLIERSSVLRDQFEAMDAAAGEYSELCDKSDWLKQQRYANSRKRSAALRKIKIKLRNAARKQRKLFAKTKRECERIESESKASTSQTDKPTKVNPAKRISETAPSKTLKARRKDTGPESTLTARCSSSTGPEAKGRLGKNLALDKRRVSRVDGSCVEKGRAGTTEKVRHDEPGDELKASTSDQCTIVDTCFQVPGASPASKNNNATALANLESSTCTASGTKDKLKSEGSSALSTAGNADNDADRVLRETTVGTTSSIRIFAPSIPGGPHTENRKSVLQRLSPPVIEQRSADDLPPSKNVTEPIADPPRPARKRKQPDDPSTSTVRGDLLSADSPVLTHAASPKSSTWVSGGYAKRVKKSVDPASDDATSGDSDGTSDLEVVGSETRTQQPVIEISSDSSKAVELVSSVQKPSASTMVTEMPHSSSESKRDASVFSSAHSQVCLKAEEPASVPPNRPPFSGTLISDPATASSSPKARSSELQNGKLSGIGNTVWCVELMWLYITIKELRICCQIFFKRIIITSSPFLLFANIRKSTW